MQETAPESIWITDNTITLSAGRLLGYARYSDLAGRPLLHFHSWPGSRLADAIPGCTAKFYPEDGQFRFLMPNRRRFGKRGTFGVPIDADFYDPRQGGLRFRYTPMSTPSRVCCPNATPRVQNSRWV